MKNIVLLATFALLPTLYSWGQPPQVSARLSADTVMIGDRFTLEIDVEKDQVQMVAFPAFQTSKDSSSDVGQENSLELMEDFPVDTLKRDGRRFILRKRYSLSAFDEGVYSMGRPAILYADKNIVDTLYARDSLRIVVATFQIDSTSHALFDIKPQKTLKFKFKEISGYLLYTLILFVILAVAVYLLQRYLKSRGRSITDLFKPVPPPPAHLVAIEALELLKNKKLWQNGKHKEYYSALSDILRTYIAGRWGIGAMEMTTEQVVDSIKDIEIAQKNRMDLMNVLRTSDLVKFAKAEPEASENEAAFDMSFYFVEDTKPVEVTEVDEDDIPTTNEKN
ncbi:MAG: hypothetical protein KBS95_02255 [Alistipes sp.]|nr:hypothetical protein [Candidatus Alistipes equi]